VNICVLEDSRVIEHVKNGQLCKTLVRYKVLLDRNKVRGMAGKAWRNKNGRSVDGALTVEATVIPPG